ncbi:hypothetical protein BD289DRAFT_439047 [Coniella lustricola]|uniref:Hydrophobin n=1 Tax=Coniella lustricola TaxID=2025994 RepID=A0A2T3A241_9PEZI|nr:hypothetical protein BD289DRAFT_439047 [Coniella lustricola]
MAVQSGQSGICRMLCSSLVCALLSLSLSLSLSLCSPRAARLVPIVPNCSHVSAINPALHSKGKKNPHSLPLNPLRIAVLEYGAVDGKIRNGKAGSLVPCQCGYSCLFGVLVELVSCADSLSCLAIGSLCAIAGSESVTIRYCTWTDIIIPRSLLCEGAVG